MSVGLSLIALAISLYASNGFAQSAQGDTPAFNTVQYNPEVWKEYKPLAGRFSMRLQGMPAEQTQYVDTALGKMEIHMAMLMVQYGQDFVMCVAAYNDFPTAPKEKVAIQRVLDGARDELFIGGKRKLISQSDIYLDSYLGREVKFEDGDLDMIQRVFLVRERLYQVTFIVPRQSASADDVIRFRDAVRQKMFDSFTVLPPGSPNF